MKPVTEFKDGARVVINPQSKYAHQAKGAAYGICSDFGYPGWVRVSWYDKHDSLRASNAYRIGAEDAYDLFWAEDEYVSANDDLLLL